MKKFSLLLAATPLVFATPAWADDAAAASTSQPDDSTRQSASAPAPTDPRKPAFTTGVAKGRDMLDTAISASSLDGNEVEKLGARSLAEVLRNIPGIRAEAVSGEGNSSYSIRGLPLASTGSKYMQFEEDGMPVIEFGDINFFAPDVFIRADLNLAQVQTIRGGSASTFASNSPGGVINLISKTGETEGGSVEISSGLDYNLKRFDFDYGGKLSDTLRFHFGGFYHQGEGERATGYDAYKGGQIKANITKEFAGGYVRLYAKYLDDRTPQFMQFPLAVSGTDANPTYSTIPGFDLKKDTLLSRNIRQNVTLDENNNLVRDDLSEGQHPVVKSFGVDAQFDVSGWTITEKVRYSNISGKVEENYPLTAAPAVALLQPYGGALATLSYASGPKAGQVIANPATLNGNGLMAYSLMMDVHLNSLDNVTNDIRANKVWKVGGGDLTGTVGYYHAGQTLNSDWLFTSAVTDVAGGGNASLLDITDALGRKQTQGGFYAFSAAIVTTGYHRIYDVDYTVDAPYASLNYHVGKVSVGGSLRYDMGRASGALYGPDLGGSRPTAVPYDINGDGTVSLAEQRTAYFDLTQPAPVDYDYHYLSYSLSANWRVADDFSAFARYSKGGRAAADRILFTPTVSFTSGALTDPQAAYDPVKQAEVGVKYRKNDLQLFLTGFWASTNERNMQINSNAQGQVQVQYIVRKYTAKGAEFEGIYQRGIFDLTAGATYTDAKIDSDLNDPTVVGNTPRHQAHFIFEVTPQVELKYVTFGVNATGTTSSYAQDSNQLKLPGYTTVNAFLQVRPTRNVQLSLNANNVFDVLGLAEVTQASIPATGIVTARAINGRTVSGSLRFNF